MEDEGREWRWRMDLNGGMEWWNGNGVCSTG